MKFLIKSVILATVLTVTISMAMEEAFKSAPPATSEVFAISKAYLAGLGLKDKAGQLPESAEVRLKATELSYLLNVKKVNGQIMLECRGVSLKECGKVKRGASLFIVIVNETEVANIDFVSVDNASGKVAFRVTPLR